MATSYIKTEDRGSVRVIADGVKTIAALFAELFALIDSTKISPNSMLRLGGSVLSIANIGNNDYRFGKVGNDDEKLDLQNATIQATAANCHLYGVTISNTGAVSYRDSSAAVPSNGLQYTLYY